MSIWKILGKKEIIVLFLGLFIYGQLAANQPSISIDSLAVSIPIVKSALFLYEDTTTSLTLEEAQSKTFKPVDAFPSIYSRNTQHHWWTKIIIENNIPTKQTWWVQVPGKFTKVYIQEKNKSIKEFQTGNLMANSQKAIPFEHKFFNYIPLEIAATTKTLTLWAKVILPETIANETDILELSHPLHAQNEYNKTRKNQSILNGIFQTALFLLMLYGIIYFLNTKALFAKYLIGYCIISSIYFLNLENYFYQLKIVAENPIISNYILLGTVSLTSYFDLQLIRDYLNLPKHLPAWDRVFKLLMSLSILFTLASLLTYYLWDNFFLSFVGINCSFALLYLVLRVAFIGRIFFRSQLHRFKIMRIALLFGIVFLLIAFAGFIYPSINSNLFLQFGFISYLSTLIISLGNDAAINQRERLAATRAQLGQQRILELKKSELKQSQQQEEFARLRNEELERLDHIKSHFFANVSHELRTPLTLMLGPLQSALADQTLSNRSFTFLKLAKTNGERLLKMVNQILDLTKLEATGLQLNYDEVHLYSFLKRLIASFESYAAQEQLRFSFDYQLDKNLILLIDVAKVEIIITNLLSNAFKFTPAHRNITLRVTAIKGGVQIEVADTGRGIHPNDLPHIFDRFYQTSRQDAQSEGGTGIGLALSKEFAHLMQGTLRVESEWQKGSSFFFELPAMTVIRSLTTAEYQASFPDNTPTVAPVAVLSEIPTKKQESTIHRPTLLIVEDNLDLSNYLKVILAPTYQLLSAKNGQVALDLLSDRMQRLEDTTLSDTPNLPDLIISDIMMPVMDGIQLLKVLKSKDYFRSIPVIILTARAGISDKLEALRIGVDDYLLKPFIEEELLTRIHNLLENYKNRVNNNNDLEKEEALSSTKSGITLPVEPAKKPIISTEDNQWLKQVETALIQNLENINYNVDDLANDLGLSKRQLDRRLKKIMAINIGQYVKEIRYAQAKKLLESRQYTSIKMVVYKVGIKDRANFARQFKKRFGKLPSTYF